VEIALGKFQCFRIPAGLLLVAWAQPRGGGRQLQRWHGQPDLAV